MPKFAFSYYGLPQFDSEEEGAKSQQAYMAWLQGLGDAVINPGTPLGEAKTVTSTGVSDNGGAGRLTGFSIVEAEDIDAAVEMVKDCPYLSP